MRFITCNFYTTDTPEGSEPSGADLRPPLLGQAPLPGSLWQNLPRGASPHSAALCGHWLCKNRRGEAPREGHTTDGWHFLALKCFAVEAGTLFFQT